ncbi:hypothetical protein F0562_023909 [Nyssa sinensis]|uniref:Uncharacterized protein n=1 Tax=Nyssa sinensis TaxID=561372 RepID=A0A5J5BLQ6_9ASTE|nr:hypothetical protein F0562_023909 [Nyssa sinensis]
MSYQFKLKTRILDPTRVLDLINQRDTVPTKRKHEAKPSETEKVGEDVPVIDEQKKEKKEADAEGTGLPDDGAGDAAPEGGEERKEEKEETFS